jgi:hypothetical protein
MKSEPSELMVLDGELSALDPIIARHKKMHEQFKSMKTDASRLENQIENLDTSKIFHGETLINQKEDLSKTVKYCLALGVMIPAAVAAYNFSTGQLLDSSSVLNTLASFYGFASHSNNFVVNFLSYGPTTSLSGTAYACAAAWAGMRHRALGEFRKIFQCDMTKEFSEKIKERANYLRKNGVKPLRSYSLYEKPAF